MRQLLPSAMLSIVVIFPVLCNAKTEPPAGRFGSTIDVRVVNVETVVTDRDGNRVTGLVPQDFSLLVDGQSVSINYFTEIQDGELAPSTSGVVTEPPAAEGLTPGESIPTNYLVFIDEFFPLKRDRDRAVRGLLQDLNLVGPSDQMAVVAYDGTKLTRLVKWTSSHKELEAALVEATERKAGGFHRIIEAQNPGTTQTEFRMRARQLEEQVNSALTAASSSMRAMAAPSGRKVMILMAGGWPSDTMNLFPLSENARVSRREIVGSRSQMEEFADTANLLGYTIYGIDVPGFEADSGSDASESGFDIKQAMRSTNTGSSLQAAQNTGISISHSKRELQNHILLQLVSDATGGLALLNSEGLAALETPAADTRTFYWLGFDAPAHGDDELHEIQLEVLRPDLEVRTRKSYLDLSREQEVTIRVESSLLFADSDDQDTLRVVVGEPERHGFKKVQVPIEVKIPLGTMMAVTTQDAYEVHLEMRVGAIDEHGQISDISVVPVVFSSPVPPQAGSYATYRTTLKLRRDAHDLLITAYDPLLDQMLASRVSVEF